MKETIIQSLATSLLLCCVVCCRVVVADSTIIHQTFPSEILDRPFAYNIYLPDDYKESAERYPVLYLLHGSGGGENDWLRDGYLKKVVDHLITEGAMQAAVIVMPGSKSWWVDGYNENAKTAFVNEFVPHIENSWSVMAAREGRFVAGISAGGYGAINFALEYPEMFGAVAALSPAIYVPEPPAHSSARTHPTFLNTDGEFDSAMWASLNYPQYLHRYLQQSLIVRMHISTGDHDTFDIAYHGAVFYQALREHQPGQVELRVIDGDHDWAVWIQLLPEALTYMLARAR